MKKTLVALMALGGMAMAVDQPFSLDNAYTAPSATTTSSAVEAVLGGNTTALNLNKLAHGCTIGNRGTDPLTTTLTLADMYTTGNLSLASGEKLVLNSIQVVSRPDTNNRPADATLTLTVGNDSVTATADYSALVGNTRGLITFSFGNDGVDITNVDTLTFSITSAENGGFGYTCYQGQNGYSLSGDTATYTPWHMASRVNVTKVGNPDPVPEPATGSLSLLALAGLASRRRRK